VVQVTCQTGQAQVDEPGKDAAQAQGIAREEVADGDSNPVLQLAHIITAAASTEARRADEDGSDDERVDEEIVMDTPPTRDARDAGLVTSPPATTPTVCRFDSPPLVFNRSCHPSVPRPHAVVARPRTHGEFLTAAKSSSDALLQTPAVRRRLVGLNFQPRRSSRIAGQPGGLNAEMKAVWNLMRKLSLLEGDEVPSVVALEAYHKMYELPLTDDMIEAITEF
jgi:hypothetical protein